MLFYFCSSFYGFRNILSHSYCSVCSQICGLIFCSMILSLSRNKFPVNVRADSGLTVVLIYMHLSWTFDFHREFHIYNPFGCSDNQLSTGVKCHPIEPFNGVMIDFFASMFTCEDYWIILRTEKTFLLLWNIAQHGFILSMNIGPWMFNFFDRLLILQKCNTLIQNHIVGVDKMF